jgi:hypothetical protein
VQEFLTTIEGAAMRPEIILILILLIFVLGGGGGYYALQNWGTPGLGGVLGLVLVVVIILFLLGKL